MDSIEKLLKEVKDIILEYKKYGKNYNIFGILGDRKEDIHSRFLANLLNPKEIHDCGDIFLSKFFEIFLPDKSKIDFSDCEVRREYYLKDSGRRPDIFVSCKDFRFVIENKIDAPDQKTQLFEYDKFLKAYGEGKYRLFYLTPDGRKSSDSSCGDTKYECLSYKNDILEWLKCCQEEETVLDKPLIWGTLEQYINLWRNKMSKYVAGKIKESAENMEAAFLISDSLLEAKQLLFEKLWNLLKKEEEKYKKEKDLHLREDLWELSHSKDWCCIAFNKQEWGQNYIRFQLESNKNLVEYGLVIKTAEISNVVKAAAAEKGYRDFPGQGVNTGTIYWSKVVSLAKLCESDKDILEFIKDKIDELLAFFK